MEIIFKEILDLFCHHQCSISAYDRTMDDKKLVGAQISKVHLM